MPVVAIMVRLLVLSCLFQVVSSMPKQLLHVLHKVPMLGFASLLLLFVVLCALLHSTITLL